MPQRVRAGTRFATPSKRSPFTHSNPMLTTLHISNYALIAHLDLDVSDGFSVITGETGAGKSIILGALGLLQGNRADTKVTYYVSNIGTFQ